MERGWRRVGLVVLVTLGVLYAFKLSVQVLELRNARDTAVNLDTEIDAFEREVIALETAAVEAEGDDYVEQWARDVQHMSREGDRPFEAVTVTLPATAPAPAEATPEPSGWRRFVDWLRGSER